MTQTTTLRPTFLQARTYLIALMFIAGNIILPQLCHLVPQGGPRWLPIYFFTLIAAFRHGRAVGLVTAIASPAVNSLLFGMPAADTLPVIMAKGILLTLAAGHFAGQHRLGRPAALALTVITYQALSCAILALIGRPATALLQELTLGLPGLLLQILGGWAVLHGLQQLSSRH